MNSKPLISVFIPYFDDELFLADAIESVLSQTYTNFELILLNHASTDSSYEIAHSYTDTRIKHVDFAKNLGAGSGVLLVEFLKIAKGKYSKLFCADDILNPDCIETLAKHLVTNEDKDFVCADMDYIDKNKKPLKAKWSKTRNKFDININEKSLLKLLFSGESVIAYPTVLIKTDALRSIDINKSFIMTLDMSIWAQLLINGKKFSYINTPLVKYRIHPRQTSSHSSAKKIRTCSCFEGIEYCKLFYKIMNIEILKYLCPNNTYIDKIEEGDEEYFPFIIATEHLCGKYNLYALCGYTYIHDLLQNEESEKKLQDKFGFGITEFRALYSSCKVFDKRAKELRFAELIFFMSRKIWKLVTLQYIFKKKKYTA